MARDNAPPPAEQPASKKPAAAAVLIAAAVAVAAPLATKWEGYAAKPYLDPAKIATYCFGETEQVDWSRIYSKDECATKLRARMARDYAPRILDCLPQLTDPARAHVFGALLDASYNAGPAAVCKSRMAVSIRVGQWKAACQGFNGWYVTARNRQTGVRIRLRGLERRRADEARVCMLGAG